MNIHLPSPRFSLFVLLLFLQFTGLRAGAEIRAAWNFNTTDGTWIPQGQGLLTLLGGVVATNYAGAPSDPGKPNGSLSLRNFPPQSEASRSAGIELAVEATGWSRLSLEFEIRASATASRILNLLGSVDSKPFEPLGRFEITQEGVFLPVRWSLPNQEDWKNATLLRLRLVSETDTDGRYMGVKPKADGSNSYSTSGTWRFDAIRIEGEPPSAPASQHQVQMENGMEQRTLRWPTGLGAATVWSAPSPQGPWIPRVENCKDSQLVLEESHEAQFFRVTWP